jgi:opacity protein-like surface antigen
LVLLPAVASADGYFVPFVGGNFGGEVGRPIGVVVKDRNPTTFGVSVGSMGAGVFGMELDLAYTSRFYPDIPAVTGGNNLLTIMPALVLGVPIGGQRGPGVRPYAVAGVGLVRRNVDFGSLSGLSANDLGYTLGGGLMIFLADHLGVRGDVRYIRNFQIDDFRLTGVTFEQGTFNVGRASAGLVLRF